MSYVRIRILVPEVKLPLIWGSWPHLFVVRSHFLILWHFFLTLHYFMLPQPWLITTGFLFHRIHRHHWRFHRYTTMIFASEYLGRHRDKSWQVMENRRELPRRLISLVLLNPWYFFIQMILKQAEKKSWCRQHDSINIHHETKNISKFSTKFCL